jgi:hypothetical protein
VHAVYFGKIGMLTLRYLRNISPAQLGILTALAVVAVAACLPIWEVWHINEWEGVGTGGPVWSAIAQLPANYRQCNFTHLLELHRENLIKAGGVYALAWIAAIGVAWFVKRRRSVNTNH